MRRALVLGAGGAVGIAWETGLLEGLLEGGVDVRSADLIIGTSAGSLVGARAAHGAIGAAGKLSQLCVLPPLPEGGFDAELLERLTMIWADPRIAPHERGPRMAVLAGSARTGTEAQWAQAMDAAHGLRSWPNKPLRIAAVDAESGQRVLLGPLDGLLQHAIRASCSVPGLCPPTAIGGRRYIDGAIASGTSADAAADIEPDHVLVIAPICARTAPFGAVLEAALNTEVRGLRDAGARVEQILPDDQDCAAFGPDLMDPHQVFGAHEAGRKRGLGLVSTLQDLW
jgi:NTE family protein